MKKGLPLLILFILSHTIYAQEALTFPACVELALSNNLELKSASYDEKIAVTKHLASYGKLLPNVYGELRTEDVKGFEIDDHPSHVYLPNDYKEDRGTVSADFNLFSGFKVFNSIIAAKQQEEIVRTRIERQRNDITIDLAQRFITILYLQDIIKANDEQIKSSDKQLEIAQLKFDSGVISESEVFKVKSQKALEELTLLTNQNKLSDNMVSLKQLMNMPLDKEITLIQPNLEGNELLASTDNESEIINKAIELQPSYKLSVLEQKRARTEWALARGEMLPSVTLRFMYRTYYDPNLQDFYAFHTQFDQTTSKQMRFYVNIPIFNGFQAQAKARAGKLRYRQSKIETQIEENKLSKNVLKAVYDVRTSVKKKEASTIAFDFTQKSYDADLLKFQLGKININELNTTKINYNSAQAELIQSKYELLFNNALIRFYSGEAFVL